jgi:hypothetical protein
MLNIFGPSCLRATDQTETTIADKKFASGLDGQKGETSV